MWMLTTTFQTCISIQNNHRGLANKGRGERGDLSKKKKWNVVLYRHKGEEDYMGELDGKAGQSKEYGEEKLTNTKIQLKSYMESTIVEAS